MQSVVWCGVVCRQPFGVKLHYFDQYPLKPEEEKALGAKHWTDMREMVGQWHPCW
jgi:lactate dehydrogenase-like 2-hydroxyacid dehydrogenase